MRHAFRRAGVAALGLAVLVSLGVASVTNAATGTNVVSGWKNGPVSVHANTDTTLAALQLSSGNWLVWAKLFVSHNGAVGPRTVTCTLGPSTSLGQAAKVDVGREDPDILPGHKMMVFQAVLKFRGDGVATVKCHATGGDGSGTTANWIKIMALQLGTVTTFQLADSTQASGGSGNPTVVYATRTDSVALPDNVNQSLGQLTLPAGAWYIRASFSLSPNGLNDQQCNLMSGGVAIGSGRNGADGGSGHVSMDGVMTSSSEFNVTAKCQGNDIDKNGYGSPAASNIRYSAVRIGTLTTFNGRGGQVTYGRGTPKLTFVKPKDTRVGEGEGYEQVGSVSVSAGKWLFFGTLNTVSREATCQLRALPDYDQDDMGTYGFNTLSLMTVHTFGASGKATLNCIGTGFDVEISDMHIAALKLTTLQNVAL